MPELYFIKGLVTIGYNFMDFEFEARPQSGWKGPVPGPKEVQIVYTVESRVLMRVTI